MVKFIQPSMNMIPTPFKKFVNYAEKMPIDTTDLILYTPVLLDFPSSAYLFPLPYLFSERGLVL